MREEELLQKMKESAEHVPVPESLEPEKMMEKLRKMDEEETSESGKMIDMPARRPSRRWYQYGAAAAACLALVTVIGRGQILSRMSRENTDVMTAGTTAATAMEAAEAADAADAAEVTGESVATGAGANPSGDMAEAADAATDAATILADADGAAQYRAKDYGEIYDRFQEYRQEEEERYRSSQWNPYWGVGAQARNSLGAMVMEDGAVEEIAEETMAAADDSMAAAGDSMSNATSGSYDLGAAETATSASGDFSGTNTQVEGVDEGDIVKTDGTYIYAASAERGTIRIIRPDGGKLELIGEIKDTSTVSESKPIQEFYVNGNAVSVIRQTWSDRKGKSIVYVETYSLEDAKNPEPEGIVEVEGNYRSSRRNGDYLYVFSGYEADPYVREDEKEKYVPCVNGKAIPAEDIYMPEIIRGYSYTVVTAVDMRKPEEPVKSKGVMGGSEQFYVSGGNIYITASKYDYKANQYDYTEIMKLGYQDGQIAFQAHGTVDGYLNNQFSMDEYQGNLRVVSTLSHQNGVETNSLYVLDGKLKMIGKIEDLAPDEQIYSARFMGNTAYFVTYRNMDPLFSADLSDPENPKLLGELKITGFSEYLHPFDDGLLLGIGQETDPETGNFKGLKLSMFDVSDPENVTEKDKTVEEDYESSPAWYNHKSVTISADKNIIGFVVEAYENREWKNYYVVYSYTEGKGFTRLLSCELPESETGYYYGYDDTRGLYIGDWFYVVESEQVTSFKMNAFQKKNVLKYY